MKNAEPYSHDDIDRRMRHVTINVRQQRGNLIAYKHVYIDGYKVGSLTEATPFSVMKGLRFWYSFDQIFQNIHEVVAALRKSGIHGSTHGKTCDPGVWYSAGELPYAEPGSTEVDLSFGASTGDIADMLEKNYKTENKVGDPCLLFIKFYDVILREEYEKLGPPVTEGIEFDEGNAPLDERFASVVNPAFAQMRTCMQREFSFLAPYITAGMKKKAERAS